MKCPECNGEGWVPIFECGFCGKGGCPTCHSKGYLNHGEFMRICSADELTAFVLDIATNDHGLREKLSHASGKEELRTITKAWLMEEHEVQDA